MKYFDLTKEENQILKDFESGKFKRIKEVGKGKKLYAGYAKNTLSKSKNINIRLSEKDIYQLKAIAVKTGLPYQTLVSSIIHRFVYQGKAAFE